MVKSKLANVNKMLSTKLRCGSTYNPSTQRQKQVDLCEFKASLVYRVNSKTATAI